MATRKQQQRKRTPADVQPSESERAIRADLRRHRVMKGYPPEGPIFELRSEAETKRQIAELKRFGRALTKSLASKCAAEQEQGV